MQVPLQCPAHRGYPSYGRLQRSVLGGEQKCQVTPPSIPRQGDPFKGPSPQGHAAHVPTLIAGKVMVSGGSSSSWELPQCATIIPTRTLLIQLPWLGSSCRVLGGTGVSHQCGCKPPHGPGIHPLPGQART